MRASAYAGGLYRDGADELLFATGADAVLAFPGVPRRTDGEAVLAARYRDEGSGRAGEHPAATGAAELIAGGPARWRGPRGRPARPSRAR
jgi:hypothetical protein